MNKRGVVNFLLALFAILVVLGFLVILSYIPEAKSSPFMNKFADNLQTVGKYLFGVDKEKVTLPEFQGGLGIQAAVITSMMLWLIVFVTFGDILSAFGALSKGVSWIVALAIGVIAAVTGIFGETLIRITKIFIWLGAGAVYAGLLFSIVVFVLVTFGLGSKVKTWLITRQQAIGEVRAARGAKKIKEGAKAMAEVGGAAEEAGEKAEKGKS